LLGDAAADFFAMGFFALVAFLAGAAFFGIRGAPGVARVADRSMRPSGTRREAREAGAWQT
jgi:hypothetical protein